MATRSVARLAVSFVARTKSFDRAMARMQKRVETAGRAIRRVGGIASLIAGGGIGVLTAKSFRLIDAQAKTADKLGITTEALAGFRHAAELSGVEARTFDMGLQRMTRRMAEAAQGTGEAKDAIKTLGLDAAALAGLSTEEKLLKVADALDKVADPGERLRLAFKLFDSEGVALVNTLRGGSKALRETMAEADLLGLSLTRIDSKIIENANDQFTRMRAAVTGVANQFALALAPALDDVVDRIVQWVKTQGGAGVVAERVLDKVVAAVGWVKAAWDGVISAIDLAAAASLKFAAIALKASKFTPVGFLANATGLSDIDGTIAKLEGAAGDLVDRAFARSGGGFEQFKADAERFFDAVGFKAADKAGKALASAGFGDGAEGVTAAAARVAEGRQIDRSRTALGVSVGARSEQRVADKGLREEIQKQTAVLMQILRTTGGQSVVVA